MNSRSLKLILAAVLMSTLMLGCPPKPPENQGTNSETAPATTNTDPSLNTTPSEPAPAEPIVEADDPDSVAALAEAGVVLKKNAAGNAVAADCKAAKLSNEQVQFLAGLHSLETLSLENSEVTNEGIAVLEHLPNLKVLSLRRCAKLNATGLENLKHVPNLERLMLLYTLTDNDGLAHVAQLKKLKVLDLRGCMQVGDAGLEKIQGLTNLVDLKLRSYNVTDAGMEYVGKLTKLRYLAMEDCGIGDEGMKHLEGLDQLRVLNVMRTSVGDDGLAHFSDNKLVDLRLREAACFGPGLDGLVPSRKTLTYLDLSETLIDNDGLSHITPFTKLKTLILWNGSMDDEGIAHLKGLVELETLDLQGCRSLTPDCVEPILSMVKLADLNLAETAIDDAGLLKLAPLEHLKRVKVSRSNVTSDGIAAFKKLKPDCAVSEDF